MQVHRMHYARLLFRTHLSARAPCAADFQFNISKRMAGAGSCGAHRLDVACSSG
jgi:hypothetical protein